MKTSSMFQRVSLGVGSFVVAVALLVTCNAKDKRRESNMTAMSERVNAAFERTRTVCFGRFVIDVPSSATVVFDAADVNWPIHRMVGSGSRLTEEVRDQLAKIEEKRYLARNQMAAPDSMYGKVIDGGVPGQKLVFGQVNNVTYRIYSYFQVGEDLFIQKADPLVDREDYTKAIDDLNRVAQALRGRTVNEVPREPGICVDGGFVPEPTRTDHERFTVGIRLSEFPDVHLSIMTTKKDIVVESDALEPRLDQARKDAWRTGHGLWYERIKVFRRGARQIAGWKGFEVLARKPAQEGEGESHEFAFLSQGEPKNPLLPVLDVQLDTGVAGNRAGAKRPSVTDDEAIAIWDRLIGSIRVRPTGGGKTAGASPGPITPLGSLTMAGKQCPTGGWWQCTDAIDNVEVSGGRKQYLRAGETVPQALLLPPATPWQKLRGEQPTFRSEIASRWKLVDRRKNAHRTPSTLLAAAGASPRATSDQGATVQLDALAKQEGSAIGTQLTSGAICTASGWWQCLEMGALDNTRWFADGAILPPATKPISLTLVEKMKGVPDFVRVPASWRLIRFADSETQVSTQSVPTSPASPGGLGKDHPGPSEDA